MKCPHCGYSDSRVLDSRDTTEGIRRRRQCLSCNGRFTTHERFQQNALFVIKKDKRREGFQKDKILNGIRKACEKRPIAEHVIEKIADEIESELIAQGKAEVPSTTVGDMVMEQLKSLDHIAYIRFASVYRDFEDITRLKQEVDSLAEAGVSETNPSQQLPLLPETEVSAIIKTGGRKRR
ncbi:MAG TPA: transcriptional regulator NrdR [Dehalococcoidales bacterium]